MGRFTTDEEATASIPDPGAGKGTFYVINTTPSTPGFKDDTNTAIALASGLSRGTPLGAAPSSFTIRVLDGGAGVGDIAYMSIKKSDDSWDWVEVIRAP
jgi:hypothetical protein